MSALAFANIGMLTALIALPVIWYFLRLMPPKPRLQTFPPLRLLLDIDHKEEEPARSPWWLTAIRLMLAAAVIFALAQPIFRPSGEVAPGKGPLLLVVENGWASAPAWDNVMATAHRILAIAQNVNRPVALMATADGANQALTPGDTGEIGKRLDALAPHPWTANRAVLSRALTNAASATPFGGVIWLSDGIGGPAVDAFAKTLSEISGGNIVAYDASRDTVALKPAVGDADALVVPVIRQHAGAPSGGRVRASDIKGRVIGDEPFAFSAGETATSARFKLPVELRNDIVRLEVVSADTAGAVQLLDERWRRRRVGLISGAPAEAAQPLLSPLYFISRAVQPFADIRDTRDANAAVAIPELINDGVSIIVMADIGTLTPESEAAVAKWVDSGGTLVRFAGPRLAAASDALVPVTLRHGDRVLGGSLSWQTPQPLGSFSADSPFADIAVPTDIAVRRQILADPDAELGQHTWATLADGTPLVTAAKSGKGWLILFHVTADPSWSNLPLSGTFVEMLRRIVAFSAGIGWGGSQNASTVVPPYRLLDGYGHFAPPGGEAEPLSGDSAAVPLDAQHPPGLYGSEEGFRALNLINESTTLVPFAPPGVAGTSVRPYPTTEPTPLGPWLVALAAALFALDALAVLWLNGAFGLPRRRHAATAATIGLAALLLAGGQGARAGEADDTFAMHAVDKTHLAYVITGNAEVDATSLAGLRGLSHELLARTSLEPGDPIGIDPAHDEMAFFPLIYWPVTANGDPPSDEAMARIDAYMRDGGSVLFDTRDQLERSATVGGLSGTPQAERLRAMLSRLDIPPLEPVPADHVLTKAFYLLNDFPGRYAGGQLWVEASDAPDAQASDRPVRAGDGVSTILITENDFAGAWAINERGSYLYPTIPTDPRQRELAFRVGINLVMYTLTGNYKADQVHVPSLLERLGQ